MPESEAATESVQAESASDATQAETAPEATAEQPARGRGERLKGLSTAALVGLGAVILVVGLVVGLAAGYKIEQKRAKDDANRIRQQAIAAAQSNSAPTASGATGATTQRLAGKVATSPGVAITVGGKPVVTSATTVVVKASPGSPSDIKAGERVVWKPKQGQSTQAQEIIVLPANAKMGSQVVSASANSMTIKSGGKNVTVSTNGATVEKVATAKTTDITAGAKMVAQVRRTNSGTLTATEMILLPATTKFVA